LAIDRAETGRPTAVARAVEDHDAVQHRSSDPDSHEAATMIRTYPICQSPAHRHQESLRGILRRLERDLEREPVLAATRQAPRPAIFESRPAVARPRLAHSPVRGLAF
jgi:hypothetical protein